MTFIIKFIEVEAQKILKKSEQHKNLIGSNETRNAGCAVKKVKEKKTLTQLLSMMRDKWLENFEEKFERRSLALMAE